MSENFLICLNAVLPVFLLMAVGYLARCCKLLDRDDVIRINKIAFRAFMPALTFYNVYKSDLSSAIRPTLIVYAVVGVVLAFCLSLVVAKLSTKEISRKGVISQGIFRSNFVIVGLPIAMSLVSGSDLGPVAVLLAVVVPVFNILAVIVLEIYSGTKADLKKMFINIITNPLIVGSSAGILAKLIGLRLPGPIETVVADISAMTSPLLIFLLGAFFRFGDVRSHAKELVSTVVFKLIVVPGIFLSLAALLGFRGVEFVALIGTFAAPTAIASFTMAQQMHGDAGLAGDVVVFSSAFCSLTLFGWSFLFKMLGMF